MGEKKWMDGGNKLVKKLCWPIVLLVVLVTISSIINLSPKNWLCLKFGKWTGFGGCQDLGVQYSTCGQTNLWHKLGVLSQSLVSEPVKVDSGSNIGPVPFWNTPPFRRGVFSIITTQTWSGRQKRPKPRHFRHWNGTSPNLVNIARFLDVSANVVSFLLLKKSFQLGILEPTKCTGSGALYGAPPRHVPHREEGMGV